MHLRPRPQRRLSAALSVAVVGLLAAAGAAPGPAQPALFPVSVVPSDDAALRQPAPRDAALTADQVLAMVRRAVDLVGGMEAVVADTARMVLLKPNVGTDSPARSGVITDDRVVRAVALLVHEAAPAARILIAEGPGGWISPELRDSAEVNAAGDMVTDGFAKAGLRAVVGELRAAGIDIDCYDLNFDRAYSLHPADGGLAAGEYSIAAAVLDADAWINIPVAKTHGAKITCAMKNHFGILPGRLYGWSKSNGTRQHPGMPHAPRQIDEAWIDLYGLTRVDLNVVDMLAGSESGAFEEDNRKQANIVLAGRNPVAADLVAARLMGFNPDDFEFAELAWQHGVGPRTIDEVHVLGADPAPLVSRWKKAGVQYGRWGEWAEHANYGMGVRYWTLLGPLPRDHAVPPAQILALEPVPGRDGWSPPVFFGHDKIDLDKHFDDPVDCSVYAFTHFTMARPDSVRLWLGSDEDLQVWIDGLPAYEYHGRRRHTLGMDRIHAFVAAGQHRLLIRAAQGRGGFDFSVNICEPIDDEAYAGNRYPGVRYFLTGPQVAPAAASRVEADDVGDDYGTGGREANLVTLEAADPLAAARSAPDTIELAPAAQVQTEDPIGLLVQVAGLSLAELDTTTLKVLGSAPFTMGHGGFGREGYYPDYGPDLGRLCGWLGLRYAISYGYGRRESLKAVHGWLAQGYTPVLPRLEREAGRRWRGSRRGSWGLVTGFRTDGERTELCMVRPQRTAWIPVQADWSGVLPGGLRENCPVLVAGPAAGGVRQDALVDSIASLALELGLRPEAGSGPDAPPGATAVPAGLSAWDWWVIDWERLPLTPAWAHQQWPLDCLQRLGERFPLELAASRRTAAQYFAGAAHRASAADRKTRLREAAVGYGEVADAMEQLAAAMPEHDEVSQLTPQDEQRLAIIEQTRPLVRHARDGERRALGALASMLGRPGLPAALTDPLERRDQGLVLFTWQGPTDDTVYDLTLDGQTLDVALREGDAVEGLAWQVAAAMPHRQGWIAAVESAPTGRGTYRVIEQPSAANGWRTVVRVDDTRTRGEGNHPSLTVWAVPGN